MAEKIIKQTLSEQIYNILEGRDVLVTMDFNGR